MSSQVVKKPEFVLLEPFINSNLSSNHSIFNFFRPEIYLLDNPTSSLDTKVTAGVFNAITQHPKLMNKTFIITSNDYKLLEYCDRVIYLSDGRIQFNGTPEDYSATGIDSNLKKYLEEKKN